MPETELTVLTSATTTPPATHLVPSPRRTGAARPAADLPSAVRTTVPVAFRNLGSTPVVGAAPAMEPAACAQMPGHDVPIVAPVRWMDALSTVLGSLGPRHWDDVEDAIDHILTGHPEVPPAFGGGRVQERALSGYEAAYRVVLSGLADLPTIAGLRWARLRMTMKAPFARTMIPVAGGLVEVLLGDLTDTFGAPARRVPLNISVLENMVQQLGLQPTAVLLSAFQVGPDARDPLPSQACLTLAAMRGYDDALLRHAATLRVDLVGFSPADQFRSARMLERAANPTLRVYAQVIDAMADSRDSAVRAAVRPLQQRLDASRPRPVVMAPGASWSQLGQKMSANTIPTQRPGF